MNTPDLDKALENSSSEPIVLKSGFYDAKGKTIYADHGLLLSEPDTILRNATIHGAVIMTGSNTVLQNCHVCEDDCAIRISGRNCSVRANQIDAPIAISVEQGAENILLAQNEASGDIRITGAVNCSVVLNRAISLNIENSVSVAVSSSHFKGKASLRSNDYLICDDNIAEEFQSQANSHINGNNITDIYARLDCGANEEILPHVNKELFIGMQKHFTVADASYEEPIGLNDYIRNEAKSKDVVILPPGAYQVEEPLIIEAEHSNTKIYAYGVYQEKKSYGNLLTLKGAENVEICGLTSGYMGESCGQGYVLEIIDERRFVLVPGAGWPNEFGKSNTQIYHRAEVNTYRQGEKYPWGDLGVYEIKHLENGLLELILDPERSPMIGQIRAGDILSCRLAGNNADSVNIIDSNHIHLLDCVLYGYAAALAILSYGNTQNAHIERWTDTVKAAPIIDEEIYHKYKQLEEQYGVSLEVYIDNKGRYRGGTPRTSSVDATHIVGSRQGLSATSCVFDSMCDDGTNQRASSGRLSALIDNGDGTTIIRYKGCAPEIYFHLDQGPKGKCVICPPFHAGDRIFIYASNGKTVCDTYTLSETREVETIEFNITEASRSKDYTAKIFEVIVPTDHVDFSAISGYDLTDNHYSVKNKVFVDNLDRNSADYTFDNVYMSNARSRCALIKTSGVTIRNCTFRNMLHTGILFSAEPAWGESSVARNVIVEKCLFDHTGYRNNNNKLRRWAPIVVMGLGSVVQKDSLLYRDIIIRKNIFTNNTHECFAYIKAAQNVRFENNIFERAEGYTQQDDALVMEVETAMDITLKGNTYPVCGALPERIVRATNFKNIIVENDLLISDIE